MRGSGGPGCFVRKAFVKNPESESQEFFTSASCSASALRKELGRALRFPGHCSLLPWAPDAEATLNLPVSPCSTISTITGPWGGLGLEKLFRVTRVQAALVPAPKAVHCSPSSRTGIKQVEEKEAPRALPLVSIPRCTIPCPPFCYPPGAARLASAPFPPAQGLTFNVQRGVGSGDQRSGLRSLQHRSSGR